MDRAWKRAEREIAKRLGGKRVPITGRSRGDVPDIAHPELSVEVKHRKALPGWLTDALAQAVASQKEHKVPIVVLHEEGQPYDDCLVLLRLSDFINL